jgi:CheY-like chemotaxis protein
MLGCESEIKQMLATLTPLAASEGGAVHLPWCEIPRLAWTGIAVASRPPEIPDPAASSDVPGDARRPDEIRVLLVDDNAATLARVSAALAPVCDIVGAVGDGQAALVAAQDLSPDVIVLDISMQGMNGFELARRLRQTGSTAVLVFLTVHNEHEFIVAARDVGALGYVEKPRLAVDLLHAVREARAGRPFFAR